MPASVSMVHVTDLYHPHVDPDDHIDLATVYGLAERERLSLEGVVIDHPPRADGSRLVDPGIQPVAQLNYLTGSMVPLAIGTSMDLPTWQETDAVEPSNRTGVDLIIEALSSADRPVVITVVGACTDVAIAVHECPDLFESACRGIYLNAGIGSPNADAIERSGQEYNVGLDPAAYAALFDAPCPLYWLPCFTDLIGGMDETVTEHGSYWAFDHRDVVPQLSDGLTNYFLYMYGEQNRTGWLQALESPPDHVGYEKLLQGRRRMWCTAGVCHAAGLTVTPTGEFVDAGSDEGVFTFDPVDIELGTIGQPTWEHDANAAQYKFRVRDTDAYADAMQAGLLAVLQAI